MIRQIHIPGSYKRNWIDQNDVVFGYSDSQHCCEHWGWGVYDPKAMQKVADEPSGMPYHFVFEEGAREGEHNYTQEVEYPDCLDIVHVTMAHDEDDTKRLVFECFCNHNGYYYHDFSFEKEKSKAPQKETKQSKGVTFSYDIYKDDPCYGCTHVVQATSQEMGEAWSMRPYRCTNWGRAVKLAERILTLVKTLQPAQAEIIELKWMYNANGRFPCEWTNTLRPDCYEKGADRND